MRKVSSQHILHLLTNKFVKDSLWAVIGNGIGNLLLLISGIIIARIIGKELYGEYGMIKSTMFWLAAFSTFGLGTTSTKYIASFKSKDEEQLSSIVICSLQISFLFSIIICVFLFSVSSILSNFLGYPSLSDPFKFLGIIIVFRAITVTSNGLLAGFKYFNKIGLNSIFSGLFMIIIAFIFTTIWGIKGALVSLSASQLIQCVLSIISLKEKIKKNVTYRRYKELLSFSFPIALQDLSYVVCNWGCLMILTKYSSIGEVGIYSVASQWNSIILFIPSLLVNVILSYFSSAANTKEGEVLERRMILLNLICSLLPYLLVLLFSDIITSFYGKSFDGLKTVLNLYTLVTIFMCISNVFSSKMIALNYNWTLFGMRFIRDFSILVVAYVYIKYFNRTFASLSLSTIFLHTHILFCFILFIFNQYVIRKNEKTI